MNNVPYIEFLDLKEQVIKLSELSIHLVDKVQRLERAVGTLTNELRQGPFYDLTQVIEANPDLCALMDIAHSQI